VNSAKSKPLRNSKVRIAAMLRVQSEEIRSVLYRRQVTGETLARLEMRLVESLYALECLGAIAKLSPFSSAMLRTVADKPTSRQSKVSRVTSRRILRTTSVNEKMDISGRSSHMA